jgi:hypothetical protein
VQRKLWPQTWQSCANFACVVIGNVECAHTGAMRAVDSLAFGLEKFPLLREMTMSGCWRTAWRGSTLEQEERRELRQEREIDNFSYSHRCTSYVRLWLGARSVCQHRRVPLRHWLRFLPFLLNTFASVMRLLVLPNLVYFFRSPQTDPDPAHRLNRRNWKLSLTYPTTESVPANIHQLCDFNGRISRHFYNRIGLYGMSRRKQLSGAWCEDSSCAINKSISVFWQRGGYDVSRLSHRE